MSMIGKALGHHIVSTLIGRGGMGKVYQTDDLKLGPPKLDEHSVHRERVSPKLESGDRYPIRTYAACMI